jgi:hypothetical protein
MKKREMEGRKERKGKGRKKLFLYSVLRWAILQCPTATAGTYRLRRKYQRVA